MAWKPKEKPLTAEEALALARKELAPFWFNSAPILAAVSSGNRATVHPIDPSFAKKSWLVIFLDPTSFAAPLALRCAREWHERYHVHELEVVIVYDSPYAALRKPEFVRREIDSQSWPMIFALDSDRMLFRAFGVSAGALPRVTLFSQGKPAFDHSGESWFEATELRLQQFLRNADPGLPLAPPIELPAGPSRDRSRIDLASVAQFTKKGERSLEIAVSGSWQLEQERVLPSDAQSALSVRSSGAEFALVAESVKGEAEIIVECGGQTVYEELRGADLLVNDSGQTIVRVKEPRMYSVLRGLPANRRDVTLRFTAPGSVALFGIRTAD